MISTMCVCVCVCVRACARACVRACVGGVINMSWIRKQGLAHLSLMYRPLHWGLHGNRIEMTVSLTNPSLYWPAPYSTSALLLYGALQGPNFHPHCTWKWSYLIWRHYEIPGQNNTWCIHSPRSVSSRNVQLMGTTKLSWNFSKMNRYEILWNPVQRSSSCCMQKQTWAMLPKHTFATNEFCCMLQTYLVFLLSSLSP